VKRRWTTLLTWSESSVPAHFRGVKLHVFGTSMIPQVSYEFSIGTCFFIYRILMLQYIGINTKYRGNHSITFEIFQGVCLDDWGFQTIGAATFLPDGSHVLYLKCLFCCMGWVGYIEQLRASRILNEKIWTLISVLVKEIGDSTILFTLMLSLLGFRLPPGD